MSTVQHSVAASPPPEQAAKHPILLVFGCTVLGAAAQIFMKIGADHLPETPLSVVLAQLSLLPSYLGALLTNFPLLLGYFLYAGSTVLLVLALRKGELSKLYPVISLTYVWVVLLSVLLFKETLNISKIVGLATIMVGVGVLGRDGK